MSTASLTRTATSPSPPVNRPSIVSVGTIVWLSSELMFFAALFAMYFTIKSVSEVWPPEDVHLNVPFTLVNAIILVLSSVTCQFGVFAAERGDVRGLRKWFVVSFLMGSVFISGQLFEYIELVRDGMTISAHPYGSVFYMLTGFHGMHVTGGLVAFLLVLGRTFAMKRFTHGQATSAIVVSYYWHFVDVVWIGLYTTIYVLPMIES